MSEQQRRRPADRDTARWAVYEEHHAAVRRYVARRVEPSAVDDLTAETFAVAWRRLPRESTEPLPWLYAVARKVVHGHRRGTARRAALARKVGRAGPDRTESGDPHDRIAGDPRLAAAFATLTAKDREALALIAWEGLDHPTAARVAGCSPGTFAVRLTRARARLRSALDATETTGDGAATPVATPPRPAPGSSATVPGPRRRRPAARPTPSRSPTGSGPPSSPTADPRHRLVPLPTPTTPEP